MTSSRFDRVVFASWLVSAWLVSGCGDDATHSDDDVGGTSDEASGGEASGGEASGCEGCEDTNAAPDCRWDADCDFGGHCDEGTCSAGAEPIESCPPASFTTRATPAFTGALDYAVGDVDGDALAELVIVDDAGLRSYDLATDSSVTSEPTLVAGLTRSLTLLRSDPGEPPDAAISTFGSEQVQIFHGDGLGGFADERVRTMAGPALSTARLRRGPDVDGLLVELDLEGDNAIHLFTSEDQVEPVQVFGSGGGFEDVDVGDLDGDGIDELLLLGGGDLAIWRANADATSYQLSTTIAANAKPYWFAGCDSMAVGDLDGSGLPELVCAANPGGSTTAVGVWSRQFGDDYLVHDAVLVSGQHSARLLADLDGDGRLELVLGPHFAQAAGGESFWCEDTTSIMGVSPMRAGDLDGDGRDELIGVGGPDTLAIVSRN
ncbi:FG-GAP-like repeat-containing protein [Nannocystaceae bacterium ST9]